MSMRWRRLLKGSSTVRCHSLLKTICAAWVTGPIAGIAATVQNFGRLKFLGLLRRRWLFRYRISYRRCLLRYRISYRRCLFRYRFSRRKLPPLNPQPDRHTYRTDSKKHRTHHDGPTPTHALPPSAWQVLRQYLRYTRVNTVETSRFARRAWSRGAVCGLCVRATEGTRSDRLPTDTSIVVWRAPGPIRRIRRLQAQPNREGCSMPRQLFDPYAVLGLPPTATPDEITHAYRRQVRAPSPRHPNHTAYDSARR